MDPNAWNFNPQAYGRLPPGAMAGNPRLDVIDQAAVAAGLAPGLQALSPPLPAHSNLQPTLGYSLQSSLSQIMDSINYGGYKSVPVGQPAFTLETPSPRTVTDHSSLRYPPVSSSGSTVKSMFDTDPHTMRETAQSSSFSSAPPASAAEPTLSWSLSNFLPGPNPTTTPFVGLHGETSRANSYGNSQPTVSLPEPPPAHSGPRTTKHSVMSRNPYQGRHDFHSHTQAHQAKPAHSQYSTDHSLQDLLERERSVHSQHRSVSHSSYEHQTSPRTQNSRSVYQSAPPPSQQTVRPPSNQSTYSDSGRSSQNSGYQNTSSAQQRTYRNSSQIQPSRSHAIPPFNNYEPGLSSPGFSSNSTSNGNSRAIDNSMNYEAVSPATPSMSESSTIDTSAINTTMSLQDFADISASQEKMPLQERVLHNSGQIQRSPHLTNTLQDLSPVHQQSPMQPSPISATGSPQVPMSSMGSPPGNISSSVPTPKNPVQAVADSTTKPKKRSKKKKPPPSIRQLAPPGQQQEMIAAAMREAQFEQNTFSSNTYMSSQANAMTQNYEQQQSIENTSNTTTEFLVAQTQSVLDQFDPGKTTPLGEPIFMTNVFGNEFVNPNEASGSEFPHISEAGGDNLMNHAVLESDNRLKQRTKAEQKQMPTMTVQSDLDEEFAHLSEGPHGIGKQSHLNGHSHQGNFDSTHSRSNPHDSPITDPNIPHPGNPNPKPQSSSGFQSSFLSFLQGKKPETLSSVTNSTVVKKPELPKYIPEPPRPRPPPRPPSPKTKSQSSTNFSDDDDSGKEEINKTVASVISNLTEPAPGDSKTSPPIRMKIKLKGLVSQPLPKKSRSKSKGSKSKSKRSSVEEFPTVVIDDEVEALPRRQTSSRKAKEKVEEKRKKRQKKKKRKSHSVSDDSSFELSDSDEDYVQLSSESEKEYDSDRDPAWNPFGEPVKRAASSDEDNGPSRKGKQTFKKMRLGAKPSVRRGSKQSVDEEEPPLLPPIPKTVLAHPIENETEGTDPDQVHSFKRGDFVIEKKDLTKYQEFPIWKIDAGRLLQKYEPFMKDGKLTHKSLSTYSSWSDAVKESFQPIKVNTLMCAKGTEFVEVQEQFLPKKPPSEGEENHPLTDSFYIYMQILLSQSLAPGFLKTIKEENESYYIGPLEKIDQLIAEKTQLINTKIKWQPRFKASLDSHPFIHVIDMPYPNSECQATQEPNQSALKVIQLHGEKYDRETLSRGDSQMQEEFKIGPLAAQYVEIYHGLKHFKYCLYKKCLAQVAALQESKGPTKSHDILDQCLQNKNWVLAILKNLDELLKKSETGS